MKLPKKFKVFAILHAFSLLLILQLQDVYTLSVHIQILSYCVPPPLITLWLKDFLQKLTAIRDGPVKTAQTRQGSKHKKTTLHLMMTG